MPLRLTRPTVGFRPTRPVTDDGQMMLPSVSVPTPTVARLAAIALAVPELEPQALRSSTYGFLVSPPRALQPEVEWTERKLAHSLRLVLPRITAPASRRRWTTKASLLGSVLRQRQRAGGVHHRRGVDVVLQQHRNAVQRAAHAPGLAFGVARVGFLECIGIGLDHGVECRAGIVDGGDAVEIGLRQRAAVQFAAGHACAQIGDVGFSEGERRRGQCAGAGDAASSGRSRRSQPASAASPVASATASTARRPSKRLNAGMVSPSPDLHDGKRVSAARRARDSASLACAGQTRAGGIAERVRRHAVGMRQVCGRPGATAARISGGA